jgi:hypothetical protein
VQFDGGNTSSSSCDTSLHENIPLTTPPALPAPVLPMKVLPAPTPQMAALPTPPPWSVHLPSYPLRVICRFSFKDSHEIKNHKYWDCWKKSERDKAVYALGEAKMKNPTALHFIKN